MGSDTILVLIGGGHSAGKKTICDIISSTISPTTPVKIVKLDKYLKSDVDDNRQGPQHYDFSRAIKDVECPHDAKSVILVHGLYALYDKELRLKAAMKVFVDCDPDVRLNRMVSEEVLHGSRQLADVLDIYLTRLRSEFIEFISPTKDMADVILPSEHPETGVRLICDGISALIKGEASQNGITSTLYPRVNSDTVINFPTESNLDPEKNRFYELS